MIAPPADWPPLPRWVQDQRLLRYGLGLRSKAGEEHLNASTPKGSHVPISSARTSGTEMLECTRSLGMASMARLSRSRGSAARPAAPPSVLDATPRYTG